jgi:hypothetical protein
MLLFAPVIVSAGLFAAYAVVDVSWDVAARHGSEVDAGLSHYAFDTGNLAFANTWPWAALPRRVAGPQRSDAMSSATGTRRPVWKGSSSRTCMRALDARSSRIRSTMRCSSSASKASTHS